MKHSRMLGVETAVVCFAIPILLAASSCGRDDLTTKGSSPPQAVLNIQEEVSRGVMVTIDASYSMDPDPGDIIVMYYFSFDDGTTVRSTTPFAAHVFMTTGVHSITLTVVDSHGLEGTITEVVNVISTTGPEVRFTLPSSGIPVYSQVPFPNNLYLNADGRLSVVGVPYKMILFGNIFETALSTLDGFGTSTGVFFWLDGPVDTLTLPRTPQESLRYGSSVFLINVDPGSDKYLERHPVEVYFDGEKNLLALLPVAGFPLKEKTTYAAVVTTKVKGRLGGNIVPSEDFARISGGEGGSEAMKHAVDLYAPVLELLEGQPDIVDRRVCSGVAVFRTQSVTADLVAISEMLDQVEPSAVSIEAFFTDDPALFSMPQCRGSLDELLGTPQPGYEESPGMDNPGGLAHTRIRTVITKASVMAPWFKKEGIRNADYGAFVHGFDGKPVIQGWKKLFFSLVLPKDPMPEGGYPVAIIQHGLNGRRDFVMVAAQELADSGIASIAIDAVGHGDRYRCPILGPLLEKICVVQDEIFNYTGAPGSDGLPDPEFLSSTLGFFELFASGISMRDNFRQTVVDLMWMTRLIKGGHLDLSTVGNPRLDGDHLFYIGDSLGGIIGALFMTVEPNVLTGVLNVAGGGIGPSLLVNSPGITGDYGDLIRLAFSLSSEELASTYSEFVNLAQAVLDPGDPINYAPYTLAHPLTGGRPKNILQIEVMWDHLVPNSSNEALATAFGIPLLKPYYHKVASLPEVASPYRGTHGFTSALVQYFPAGHGTNIANQYYDLEWQLGFPFETGERFRRLPECAIESSYPWCRLPSPIRYVQEQIVRFFTSYLETGVPEIVSTLAPDRDFDHDGRSDEDEIKEGTDPLQP